MSGSENETGEHQCGPRAKTVRTRQDRRIGKDELKRATEGETELGQTQLGVGSPLPGSENDHQ